MKLYKLTDANLKTYNGFTYRFGETATAPGVGQLCTAGWLHAYTNPILAVLLNPINTAIENPRLFWFNGEAILNKDNIIVGVRKITLFPENELPVPKLTREQKACFAIHCSRKVFSESLWSEWSYRWLVGDDRTIESSNTAAAVAETDAYRISKLDDPSAEAAAWSAAWAAWAAADINADINPVNDVDYFDKEVAEAVAWSAFAMNGNINFAEIASHVCGEIG